MPQGRRNIVAGAHVVADLRRFGLHHHITDPRPVVEQHVLLRDIVVADGHQALGVALTVEAHHRLQLAGAGAGAGGRDSESESFGLPAPGQGHRDTGGLHLPALGQVEGQGRVQGIAPGTDRDVHRTGLVGENISLFVERGGHRRQHLEGLPHFADGRLFRFVGYVRVQFQWQAVHRERPAHRSEARGFRNTPQRLVFYRVHAVFEGLAQPVGRRKGGGRGYPNGFFKNIVPVAFHLLRR